MKYDKVFKVAIIAILFLFMGSQIMAPESIQAVQHETKINLGVIEKSVINELATVAAGLGKANPSRFRIPDPEPVIIEVSIYDYILEQCEELGINPYFAMSILRRENSLANPDPTPNRNRNGTQDLGMWQLNSRYVDYFVERFWHGEYEFDVHNAFDNTYVALRLIQSLTRQMKRHFSTNIELRVAMAYNAGASRVIAGEGIPQASINYAHSVINTWQNMQFPEQFTVALHSLTIERIG